VNTLPISLCDVCRAPGQCCKSIWLSRDDEALTLWDDEDKDEQLRALGLPFHVTETVATFTAEDSGRKYSTHRYRCPVLRADGRCGDYDKRPGLCRRYAAGEDGLCAMFVPAA
jgi:Fe-S-cluster containining protein